LERLHGLFSCMERAEWRLSMNIKFKLLAMARGFARALFPGCSSRQYGREHMKIVLSGRLFSYSEQYLSSLAPPLALVE
jgi:hypothetical protein